MQSQRYTGSLILSAVLSLVNSGLAQARSKPGPASIAADLVLKNGKIITVDPKLGTVHALAIRGDRIVAVGSREKITSYISPATRVIDLRGKTAIPGFIEGHAHFAGMGEAAQILDLRHIRSWSDAVDMVAAAVARAKPGEWILGRGWHQEKWDGVPQDNVEGFPTHGSMSAVSPDNPVRLTHASGHASFFNQKAMKLAGIDKDTVAPKGGDILHDAEGHPSGVFRETAAGLLSRAQRTSSVRASPAALEQRLRKSLRLADAECIAKGVTSFQDAGASLRSIDVMKSMAEAGELKIRLFAMIRGSNRQLARQLSDYRMIGIGNNHLTVRAVKVSIDGALGSRGAWLLEPYADAAESRGLETVSVKSASKTAALCLEHGFQFCVHAIGDRANREVLDIYEKTFASDPLKKDLRWRIEHAQHIHPDDITRFGKLGVVASMQGVHCTSDAPWVEPRLGAKRAKEGAYVWQSLMKSGALVTNGTDAPVEDVNPLISYYASVTRRAKDGTQFYPEQCMSRMEALESYTINAARAAFEEDLKGTLTPGKLADIVILSQDITTVEEAEILETEVLQTIIGGELVYTRDDDNR